MHVSATFLRLSTASLMGLLLASLPAKAETVYTSSSAFFAATTSQTTITFNGLGGDSNTSTYVGYNQPYTTGGATFSSPTASASVTSPGYVNLMAPAYGSDYFAEDYGSPDQITVTFPNSTAVGFNTGGIFKNPISIVITLSDNTVYTFSNLTNDYTASGSLSFFGFTSTAGINSVNIHFNESTDGNTFGALDNFTYATARTVAPTPEPGSLALLGTGAAALFAAIRRRRVL